MCGGTKELKKEFSYYWFNKWFIDLYVKLRPIYLKTFHAELKKVIESCIRKGFIKRFSDQDGIFLMDQPDAKKLISWAHYPRIFFGNAYVKAIIISIISLIATYYAARILGVQPKL